MSVWITGDIHSNAERFSNKNFPEQKGMTKEDFVICLGDFGLIWNYKGEDEYEEYWLDWLNERPFTMLFIDGNHENYDRLDAYSTEEWHGGKVHFIRPSVIHLTRGQVFDINGKNFFAFGGARSHDISGGILELDDPDFKEKKMRLLKRNALYRVNHVSWWERELPNEEEMQEGLKNLKIHHNKVDFILTHTPYTSLLAYMSAGFCEKNYFTDYLQKIKQEVKYGLWAFGHMHENTRFYPDQAVCLYEQLMQIL